MKRSAREKPRTPARRRTGFVWRTLAAGLLITPLCMAAISVEAAQIAFSPNGLRVSVTAGEAITVPVAVRLDGPVAANGYANFSLSHINGNLDRSWTSHPTNITLTSRIRARQFVMQFRVPEDVDSGLYSGVFRTVGLRTNQNVAPAEFAIHLDVSAQRRCSQIPLFSAIDASGEAISARNNKPVVIDLAGTVTMPEECEMNGAWYRVTDEYGELDSEDVLTVDDDGRFSVAVPLLASRRGGDKDGRRYTVSFLAENQAGRGESGATTIVVTHDNGRRRSAAAR